MSSADYLPGKDLDLQAWMNTFMTYLAANLAHFGLLPADIADLQAIEPEFMTARNLVSTTLTTYRGLVSDKDDKRAAMVSLIRPMVANLQTHPETTNQDRDALGIPRRGEASSVSQSFDLDADRPVAGINIGTIRRHALRIQNDNEGVISPGKPEGAKSVEIWVKVGEPPVGEPETTMRYVNTWTKNKMTVPFGPDDGNKQAHYKMRWVYTNGQKGAWSELQSATIAA